MSFILAPRAASVARAGLVPAAAFRPAFAGLRTSAAAARPNPQSVPMSQEENLNLLNKHRSVRPISPHLTIYRYPLNMYMSISNRITGAALSAGLYAGAIAYVGLPYLGLGDAVTASSVVGFAAGLPLWAKLSAKTLLAVPFVYHTINGVRHLIWDTGRLLSLPKMQVSGITTLIATGISTVGLVGYGIYW